VDIFFISSSLILL